MKLQKETKAHGRWYDDACGTAFAMELIGTRWSLLVVRELMFGPRRFSDLRTGLPGISAKVLTERLEGLEQGGILCRRLLPPPAPAQLYELTDWGRQADEVIMVLGRWAAASPDHDPTLPLSTASLMMSFRTMFDPRRADGLTLSGGFWIAADVFNVRIIDGQLSIEREAGGSADAAHDFTMAAPAASVIAGAVYGKLPWAELALAGLEVTGEAGALRFIDIFHLPDKIS